MSIDINDPVLTAYALGELDDDERSRIEIELESSPEARQVVNDIRHAADELTTGLQVEPALGLSDRQRFEIESLAAAEADPVARLAIAPRQQIFRLLRPAIAVAASIVIIAGMSWAYQSTQSHSLRQIATTREPGPSAVNHRFDTPGTLNGPVQAQPTSNPQEPGESAGPSNEVLALQNTPTGAGPDGVKPSDQPYDFFSDENISWGFQVPFGDGQTTFKRESAEVETVETVPGARFHAGLYDKDDSVRMNSAKRHPERKFAVMLPASPSSNPQDEGNVALVIEYADLAGPGSQISNTSATGVVDTANVYYNRRKFDLPADVSHDVNINATLEAEVYTGFRFASKFRNEGDNWTPGERMIDVDADGRWMDPSIYGQRILLPRSESSLGAESYDPIPESPFRLVSQSPLSTFSIDVDTASYSNVRRHLHFDQWPPAGAVRIEEMVNYFDYDYPQPEGDDPFGVDIEVASCPWREEHRLVRVGLKGYELEANERPMANLVFLLDVSGSMNNAYKLPLVKESMRMLVENLTGDDYVAIVVYAGAAGEVLPSTSAANQGEILDAIDDLQSGGSTNAGEGIQLAYQIADDNFIEGGINRVILATDGDFNVGITNRGALDRLITEEAKKGVFLSVLGFGMGNLKDSTMESLADKGNGNYAYIDSSNEAHKVLVEQLTGTLVTIAKDVKIQIEFNSAQVTAYRLIGYENRILAAQDFNDDRKDAGEIGAGHTVTALYEVVPVGVELDAPSIDPLKYQPVAEDDAETEADAAAEIATDDYDEDEPEDAADFVPAEFSHELLTLKLRYKQPDGDTSTLMEYPVIDDGGRYVDADEDFQFAAAVASFGMLLRDSSYKGDATFDSVYEMAESGLGEDYYGYRAEFLELIDRASELAPSE